MDDLVVHGRASSGSVAAAVAADSRPGTSRGLTVAAAHETPSKPSLADDSWGESAEDESAPPTPPAAAPLTSTPAGRAPVARVQRSEVRANTGSQVTSTGGQVTSTGGQVHAVRPSTGSGGRPGTSSGSGTRQRAVSGTQAYFGYGHLPHADCSSSCIGAIGVYCAPFFV